MRILICEDESLLRQGMTHLLEHAGYAVVGTAANAEELTRQVEERDPDLVITDIRMPPSFTDEGLRAAVQIRAAHPTIGVVVLSQHLQRRYAVELVSGQGGGVGYLLKQRVADMATFCDDLERVAAGGTVLDPDVIALMITRADREDATVRRLTARQQQVLALMAEGRSNAAIADRLTISEKAVVQHSSHIYDQLGLAPSTDDHRRVLAVIQYLSS